MSETESAQLTLLQRLQAEGEAGGLRSLFASHGVLVMVLPTYGEKETETFLCGLGLHGPDREQGRKGKNSQQGT